LDCWDADVDTVQDPQAVGLDVPVKIEAAKASLERRVEEAADHVKQVAVGAAVIAALSAIATITAAMAVGVGLIALYRWTADAYGAYAALGVVGVILVVATVILATAAAIKSKSLAPNRIKLPRYGATSDPGVTMSASAVDAEPHSVIYSLGSPTAATAGAPTASSSDLLEPWRSSPRRS